jgi:hypothetical protein
MLDKIKQFITLLNSKGIPLPVLRDPINQAPSVTLTMMFVSFNTVLIGLIGKFSNKLGGIDLTQAIYWFGICAGLYLGRRMTKTGDTLNIEKKEEN